MKHLILVTADAAVGDSITSFIESLDIRLTVYDNSSSIFAGRYGDPNLFMVDNEVSGVSAGAICRHIKSFTKSKQVPVIIIATNSHQTKQAFDAGASAVLLKPFVIADVKKLLSRFIS